jgi:hypothetical protein
MHLCSLKNRIRVNIIKYKFWNISVRRSEAISSKNQNISATTKQINVHQRSSKIWSHASRMWSENLLRYNKVPRIFIRHAKSQSSWNEFIYRRQASVIMGGECSCANSHVIMYLLSLAGIASMVHGNEGRRLAHCPNSRLVMNLSLLVCATSLGTMESGGPKWPGDVNNIAIANLSCLDNSWGCLLMSGPAQLVPAKEKWVGCLPGGSCSEFSSLPSPSLSPSLPIL